ncbi:MAG: [LysW]-lysine hydrolase [Leptolyngbya sp. PLA1]|nr:[LysW]-lysine hydrolase [Leptolyngbya sp. PLA1]
MSGGNGAEQGAEGLALLRELVEVPSVSGSERGAAALLVERMLVLGLDAWIDDAGNAVGVVSHPEADGTTRDIVLLGHIDTVPGVVPVRVEDGCLWGRGTVDAKGPLVAAVLAAARARLPRGVRVVVIGAVEEEAATSRGARHAAREWAPAACIIAEPSGADGFAIGYKGRLLARYERAREVAHSARAEMSAADSGFAWWGRVLEGVRGMRGGGSAFEAVQATLRAVRTESDGLMERVVMEAGFRLPPGVTAEMVEGVCRGCAAEGDELGFSGREEAHVAERGSAVARALSGAIRSEGMVPRPKLKTGTCDFNVVGPAWGCPIAAYGPGDSTLDHTPAERVSTEEFGRGVRVLTRAVESLAGELAAGESVTGQPTGRGTGGPC